MIKQSEILKAARDKLKTICEIPIYLSEVVENFKSPCFFLKLIKKIQPENESANRFSNDCLLIVAYYEQKGVDRALNLYDIQDAVILSFWRGFKVGKRYLHLQEIQCDFEGSNTEDIVYVAMNFSYFDVDNAEETLPLIGKVYQSERLKGTEQYHCKIGVDENGEIKNADG